MKRVLVCSLFMAAMVSVTACGGEKKANTVTETAAESQVEEIVTESDTQNPAYWEEDDNPFQFETEAESSEVSTEDIASGENAETAEKPAEDALIVKPADIVFERKYEGDYELAVVTAYDKQGGVMWKYETGQYEFTELDQTDELGICENRYYLADGGEVICLKIDTGDVIWKCDGIGAENESCFDQAGNIYVASYYNPMLCKIDKDGKIVWMVEEYQGCMWPFEIRITNNDKQIVMDCYVVEEEPVESMIYIDPATGEQRDAALEEEKASTGSSRDGSENVTVGSGHQKVLDRYKSEIASDSGLASLYDVNGDGKAELIFTSTAESNLHERNFHVISVKDNGEEHEIYGDWGLNPGSFSSAADILMFTVKGSEHIFILEHDPDTRFMLCDLYEFDREKQVDAFSAAYGNSAEVRFSNQDKKISAKDFDEAVSKRLTNIDTIIFCSSPETFDELLSNDFYNKIEEKSYGYSYEGDLEKCRNLTRKYEKLFD